MTEPKTWHMENRAGAMYIVEDGSGVRMATEHEVELEAENRELRAKRDDFRQQCADLIGKTNRQAVRIDELEAENARLEARWYDLKAENARLKERECFGDADACACALHYEENTRL